MGASGGEPPLRRPLPRSRKIDSTRPHGAFGVSSADHVSVPDRPIVIIDRRLLARDCMVKCLRDAIEGRDILAFASAAEWLSVAGQHPGAGVVLLCVPRYQTPQGHDDDFRLLRSGGDVPCIVVSDTEDCDQAISAVEDGAQGFLPSSVSLDVAVQAVRLVEAGGTFIPARLLILAQKTKDTQGVDGGSPFTVRQSAVLAALHQGRSNKQIAYQLQMSEGTVKVHIREIMKKVKAKNRTEVVLRTQHQQG